MLNVQKLSLFLGITVASSLNPRQSGQSSEPCAELSDLAQDNAKFLPADLTLSCLQSVPLAKDEDALQLAGLKVFLEFQSDLDYYGEQMPPGWIYPAVNLTSSLEELTQKLEDDYYDNEYDFQLDLYKLISSAYDGHLVYIPDIVGVFQFLRVKSIADSSSNDSIQAGNLFSLMSVSTFIPVHCKASLSILECVFRSLIRAGIDHIARSCKRTMNCQVSLRTMTSMRCKAKKTQNIHHLLLSKSTERMWSRG